MYINGGNVTHFHSFGVEKISNEILTFIGKEISQQIFIEYKNMIQ